MSIVRLVALDLGSSQCQPKRWFIIVPFQKKRRNKIDKQSKHSIIRISLACLFVCCSWLTNIWWAKNDVEIREWECECVDERANERVNARTRKKKKQILYVGERSLKGRLTQIIDEISSIGVCLYVSIISIFQQQQQNSKAKCRN